MFVLLVNIVVLVLVFYLCPSSVRVLATFPGTVLFPLLCSVFQFPLNTFNVLQYKKIVYYTTVKHNYNSSISTVRIQLHVSALYVGHLQVEIF